MLGHESYKIVSELVAWQYFSYVNKKIGTGTQPDVSEVVLQNSMATEYAQNLQQTGKRHRRFHAPATQQER